MSTPSPGSQARDEAVDLREYLRPIWQRKWLVLAIIVIAAGGAAAIGKLHRATPGPNQYTVTSEIYFDVADPTSMVGISVPAAQPPTQQQMGDQAQLFLGQSITDAVYRRLHMTVGSAGSVSAGPSSKNQASFVGTSILDVTTTSSSPALAAKLANTYVDVYLASRAAAYKQAAAADAQEYTQQLDVLPNTSGNSATRNQLRADVVTLQAQAGNPQAEASQVSPATAASASLVPRPKPRSPLVDGAIGAALGLLLGLAVAFGLSLFDRRMMRVNAIQTGYRREVLGVLPHVANAAPLVDGQAVVPVTLIEALRALRISLNLSGGKRGVRSLLITSAMPGEGKSTAARNLALVCAEGGERVLLIDADLRRPSVPRMFGIDSEVGLTHVLAGSTSPGHAVVRVFERTHEPQANGSNGDVATRPTFNAPIVGTGGSLDVLTHGDLSDSSLTLFGSRAMETLLASARDQYDIVIIDSAPLLAVTDTIPLMSQVDGVVIVARLGVTTRDAAARLNDTVGRVRDAKILGVLANDMRDSFLDSGYGGMYSSRYGGYGYRGGTAEPKQATRG
ncbi:MAG: P-loop NTPase [Solirubrobacteraceae bacterium]|jgi:Mrp family chromosome partitioning ATPase